MPLREERGVGKLLGTSCKEILRKRPSGQYSSAYPAAKLVENILSRAYFIARY
jgi:hypothetical protein